MSIRQQKACKQLKKCLSEYFIINYGQLGQIPNVTKVTISKDLKNASVYIFVDNTLSETRDLCNELNKNTYTVNQFMIKNVLFRVLPKLKFVPDKEQKDIDDIKQILNNL